MSDEPTTKKRCFVIGPIGEPGTPTRTHADWLLNGVILPVFQSLPDFEVERADGISAPGNINSQVIVRLLRADLVIADVSARNANAFYELGIRHMKRLPTIHVIKDDENIPFDVAPYRAIKLSFSEYKHIEKARTELRAVVDEVTRQGFVVENPVTNAWVFSRLKNTLRPKSGCWPAK